MDALDLGWSEETVTDVAVHKGHPTVRVSKFNKKQEGEEHLWWWLDRSSGVCFGILVQAKRDQPRRHRVEARRTPQTRQAVRRSPAGAA